MTKAEWWDELPTLESSEKALDLLLQRYDRLLRTGRPDQADEELGRIDLDKVEDTTTLYSIVAVASWYEARPFLKDLLGQVEARLLEVTQDPPRVERILSRLKAKAKINRE